MRSAIREPRVSEAATRLPSGMRSSSLSTAAVRAGVSQKPVCQTCENGNVRHQREGAGDGGRQAHGADPAVQQARPLDHRGHGDRHQDGVVLEPRLPVGEAVRDEPPAEGGQRHQQEHRRPQGHQAGRDQQVQHRPRLHVRAVNRVRQRVPRPMGRVEVGLVAGALDRRQHPQQQDQRRRPHRTTIAASPSRRDPRRNTTRPSAATREAEVLLDQHERQRPEHGRAMVAAHHRGHAEREQWHGQGHLVEVEADQGGEPRGEAVADRHHPRQPSPPGHAHQRHHADRHQRSLGEQHRVGRVPHQDHGGDQRRVPG